MRACALIWRRRRRWRSAAAPGGRHTRLPGSCRAGRARGQCPAPCTLPLSPPSDAAPASSPAPRTRRRVSRPSRSAHPVRACKGVRSYEHARRPHRLKLRRRLVLARLGRCMSRTPCGERIEFLMQSASQLRIRRRHGSHGARIRAEKRAAEAIGAGWAPVRSELGARWALVSRHPTAHRLHCMSRSTRGSDCEVRQPTARPLRQSCRWAASRPARRTPAAAAGATAPRRSLVAVLPTIVT
eukprot:356093-Chlamydomonas_euryale.AAC.5